MLGAEHLWLAQLGATSGIDRFADTDAWSRLPTGEPVFHGAFAWIRGRVCRRLIAGASVVYIVQALEASLPAEPADRDVPPLVYYNRTWHALGPTSVII
jgi:flavin reductase (DIM6/NTAB) family NADH-FMN oxidoreductase RutF